MNKKTAQEFKNTLEEIKNIPDMEIKKIRIVEFINRIDGYLTAVLETKNQ